MYTSNYNCNFFFTVYPYYEKLATNQLKMRLKRIKHGLILRERKSRQKVIIIDLGNLIKLDKNF